MKVEFDSESMMALLKRRGVRFVLIGGLAARTYNSSYSTDDADICYSRDPENLKRILKVLKELQAQLRNTDPDVRAKFILDEKTLNAGLNFTFDTKFGPLDILGEVAGLGMFDEVARNAVMANVDEIQIPVLTLKALISSKKAAGRDKDLALIPQLELMLHLPRNAQLTSVFSSIEHFALAARDTEALSSFYCQNLAFKIVTTFDNGPSKPKTYMIQLGNSAMLEIFPADASLPSHERPNAETGLAHIAISVADFDKAVQLLNAAARREGEERAAPGGARVQFYRDPEGNLFHVVWRPMQLSTGGQVD